MAIYNAIRIDHRNHVNNIVFQYKLCFFTLTKQFIDNALANKGALCFARMLPSHNDNCLSVISFFVERLADGETFYSSFGQGLACCESGDKLFVLRCFFIEVLIQLLQGVRIRMRNQQLIFLEGRTDFESKLVVHPFWVFPWQDTLLVDDILPLPSPPFFNIRIALILSHTVDCRRHAVVEQWIWFGKVDDWKGVLTIRLHILNWEKEPLVVAHWVDIIRHDQIVLKITDLYEKRRTLKAAKRFPL